MRDKMIGRVSDLVRQHGISQGQPTPITNGASGAFVFDIDGKYVAKYTRKSEQNAQTYPMFIKEYDFYRMSSGKGYDFVPDIVFQTISEEEILIVMKKYRNIKIEEWNDELQRRAMRLCARINAMDAAGLHAAHQDIANIGDDYDTYPLSVSLGNWKRLHDKFPEHIDAMLLTTMYESFDAVNSLAEALAIPKTLCHGDFHPGNFLMDGDKLILCDWQTVGISKGIGDVAFFINRGTNMGIPMNQGILVDAYHQSILHFANVKIEIEDLYRNIAASDFYVSFKFWAEHLQGSDLGRVLSIYHSMVNSYKMLTA